MEVIYIVDGFRWEQHEKGSMIVDDSDFIQQVRSLNRCFKIRVWTYSQTRDIILLKIQNIQLLFLLIFLHPNSFDFFIKLWWPRMFNFSVNWI